MGLRKIKFLMTYKALEGELVVIIAKPNNRRDHFSGGLRNGLVFDNEDRQKGGPQLERMT